MNNYVMEQYGTKEPFASFLPGIAGVCGIPMWCYYVNRGQGVVSFGVKDKDHSIMEFYPAHTAYQVVSRMGFRTFIKKAGKVSEAFSDPVREHKMEIAMNSMSIEDKMSDLGIKVRVTYFILPEEPLAGLVRKVEIVADKEDIDDIEILDGMPALIPFGVDMTGLKEMSETSKAWMQAEELFDGVGYYRVRASMEDSAKVNGIEGGNFAFALNDKGKKLKLIYDPVTVFKYDTSFTVPMGFVDSTVTGLSEQVQNSSNEVPCAFFGSRISVKAGESVSLYELFGQVEKPQILKEYLNEDINGAYFEEKLARATALSDELSQKIKTHTADSRFDSYSAYTYMDNVLRGGYPIRIGSNKNFYVYSRKHGDLERDYNYFSMLPEYYSQGNGNFRDVNQNRRNDTFFSPFVEADNICTFYNLIQPDGYNPLGVEMQSYSVPLDKVSGVLKNLDKDKADVIREVIAKPFTPGALKAVADDATFISIMDASKGKVEGDYKEGYWSDHWDYNLDLIEEYLAVYPEREEELFSRRDLIWFAPQARINPRHKRYEKTENGIRQYHSLSDGDYITADKEFRDLKGNVIKAGLLEKLLVMTTVKFATLDPYGMGVEMEGGKPGWYDALNGLPGMLGSSMPETCELLRMALYLRDVIKRYNKPVEVLSEAAGFIDNVNALLKDNMLILKTADAAVSEYWNAINDIKEEYREKIYSGVSGESVVIEVQVILDYLDMIIEAVNAGIKKAEKIGGEVFPTYFYFDVIDYVEDKEGIYPKDFKVGIMPLFLEGPVRYFKLPKTKEEKYSLYMAVKNSKLYDKTLKMYKVNAALKEASIEIGRCRSFTPGWLENESIWLHMEYKYLLELLKSGLYLEYFEDFKNACVSFLDADTYGRNPMENSSFIASSANPDKKKWGRGFVARLSGSTAEFLSMWRRMFFGERPFIEKDNELIFAPAPVLPDYLIPEDGTVRATLLGSIPVTYHLKERKNLIPGTYEVKEYVLVENGIKRPVKGSVVKGKDAVKIRNKEIDGIEIII